MKKKNYNFLILVVSVLVSSCTDGVSTSGENSGANSNPDGNPNPGGNSNPANSLALNYVTAPIELAGIAANFASDVSYGTDGLNTFDIFLPDAAQPTGLIIYVHGGGFTAGDKSSIYQNEMANDIRESLTQGIAFASINYRLLTDSDTDGVIKPLGDSRRALQFMRYHANSLNIDSSRVAMYGESAGAGTSLWLAYHDDMADSSNADPILRESTRIAAVGAIETQASYDIVRWENDVFVDYGVTISSVQLASPILAQRLMAFYGASSVDELNTDVNIAYRANVDMLSLMSVDDPDTWLRNSQQPLAFPTNVGLLFHHAFHAREIREQANAIGLVTVSYIPELDISDASGEDVIPFLVRHIQ